LQFLTNRQSSGKTNGSAVHSAVQTGVFGPNERQNQRQRRSFCRSNRCFWSKRTAKPTAAPFIPPFKQAFLGQTNGKTNGSAVHFAVHTEALSPKARIYYI
jgi:hypothetical protein